jgi:hypothetical protein
MLLYKPYLKKDTHLHVDFNDNNKMTDKTKAYSIALSPFSILSVIHIWKRLWFF